MRICIFGSSAPLAQMDLAHADFRQQLSELLGRRVQTIRKTDENPARISVIDVAALLTGKNSNDSAEAIRNICLNHPEVKERIFDFKFPRRLVPTCEVRHEALARENRRLLPRRQGSAGVGSTWQAIRRVGS